MKYTKQEVQILREAGVSEDVLDDIEWWRSPVTGGFDWDALTFPLGVLVLALVAFVVWVIWEVMA